MREFFRGWRRKSGVLTLLMALVFMAVWVRGFTTADQIEFYPGATTFHTWFSENGNLGWESGDDFERTTPREKQWRLIWTHYQIEPELDFESGNIRHLRWMWVYLRIYFRRQQSPAIPHLECYVRCSSIIIPLTLLSLWLILFTPRKSTQKKIADPIPFEKRG